MVTFLLRSRKEEKTSPFLAKVVQLNTYLSYQNHGSADLSEIEYFAKNYFQLVDWTDPDLHYMPWVFEGISGWVQTLAMIYVVRQRWGKLKELAQTMETKK